MSPTTHSLPEKRIQRIVKESEGHVRTEDVKMTVKQGKDVVLDQGFSVF